MLAHRATHILVIGHVCAHVCKPVGAARGHVKQRHLRTLLTHQDGGGQTDPRSTACN